MLAGTLSLFVALNGLDNGSTSDSCMVFGTATDAISESRGECNELGGHPFRSYSFWIPAILVSADAVCSDLVAQWLSRTWVARLLESSSSHRSSSSSSSSSSIEVPSAPPGTDGRGGDVDRGCDCNGGSDKLEQEGLLASANAWVRQLDLAVAVTAPVFVGASLDVVSPRTMLSVLACWHLLGYVGMYIAAHLAFKAAPNALRSNTPHPLPQPPQLVTTPTAPQPSMRPPLRPSRRRPATDLAVAVAVKNKAHKSLHEKDTFTARMHSGGGGGGDGICVTDNSNASGSRGISSRLWLFHGASSVMSKSLRCFVDDVSAAFKRHDDVSDDDAAAAAAENVAATLTAITTAGDAKKKMTDERLIRPPSPLGWTRMMNDAGDGGAGVSGCLRRLVVCGSGPLLWPPPARFVCALVASRALLYASVLSPGGLLVAWLRGPSVRLSSTHLGAFRSVMQVSGLVGTFFAPRLVRSQGVLSALLLSQVQQWACLAVSVALFHAHDSVASAHVDGDSSGATMVAAFLACLCGSRVGLWSSDLAQLQLLQYAYAAPREAKDLVVVLGTQGSLASAAGVTMNLLVLAGMSFPNLVAVSFAAVSAATFILLVHSRALALTHPKNKENRDASIVG